MSGQGELRVRAQTAVDRIGAGTGQAIRKIYQPDAACDERIESLLDQLRTVTGTNMGEKQ